MAAHLFFDCQPFRRLGDAFRSWHRRKDALKPDEPQAVGIAALDQHTVVVPGSSDDLRSLARPASTSQQQLQPGGSACVSAPAQLSTPAETTSRAQDASCRTWRLKDDRAAVVAPQGSFTCPPSNAPTPHPHAHTAPTAIMGFTSGEQDCPICLEALSHTDKVASLQPCQHKLHMHCFKVLETHVWYKPLLCPLCRESTTCVNSLILSQTACPANVGSKAASATSTRIWTAPEASATLVDLGAGLDAVLGHTQMVSLPLMAVPMLVLDVMLAAVLTATHFLEAWTGQQQHQPAWQVWLATATHMGLASLLAVCLGMFASAPRQLLLWYQRGLFLVQDTSQQAAGPAVAVLRLCRRAMLQACSTLMIGCSLLLALALTRHLLAVAILAGLAYCLLLLLGTVASLLVLLHVPELPPYFASQRRRLHVWLERSLQSA